MESPPIRTESKGPLTASLAHISNAEIHGVLVATQHSTTQRPTPPHDLVRDVAGKKKERKSTTTGRRAHSAYL